MVLGNDLGWTNKGSGVCNTTSLAYGSAGACACKQIWVCSNFNIVVIK